jgi:hypothetical protein
MRRRRPVPSHLIVAHATADIHANHIFLMVVSWGAVMQGPLARYGVPVLGHNVT